MPDKNAAMRWLFALFAVGFLLASPAAHAEVTCAKMGRVQMDHVTILSTDIVDSGNFHEPIAPFRTFDKLPAFCRVQAVVSPVPHSRIAVDVWLPLKGWSGRLQMTGNGGYDPAMSYRQLSNIVRSNDVAVATNTGHEGGGDPDFAIGRPESLIDWSYRAVHESVVTAKALTKIFYGKPASFAYFNGCSTGGHQGLMSAQRYPEDFNGVIAGAPGNNRTALMMSFLWQFLSNHPAGDNIHAIVTAEKLVMLTKAVTKFCDPADGVTDGVINDPRACRFDVGTLLCKAGDKPDCLTADQLAAIRKMYAGPRDARTGRQIYPGYTLGSEGVPAYSEGRPGWSEFLSDAVHPDKPRRADFFQYWAGLGQNWDWWKFNWGSDVDAVQNGIGKTTDANDADLSRFRDHGGKLMMFMGWADPVGSAIEAINYYNAAEALGKGKTERERRAYTQQAVRLYMVPGMVHCANGPGATNFSPRSGYGPVQDAHHDMQLALEAWVEKGIAPEEIIATHYEDAKSKKIAFQRPLCVFPKVAVYKGGDTARADSFFCRVPSTTTAR
jgi:feruloyl esterase